MRERLTRWGWAALVALLPVTTLPFIYQRTGQMVAPPSALILLALLAGGALPFVRRGGRLPKIGLPLYAFALAAVASTVLAFFLPLPMFKEESLLREALSGLLTLGMGLAFYLVTSVLAADEDRLRLTLRVINWSGLVVLLWAAFQAFIWFTRGGYPDWMDRIQGLWSPGLLFAKRVNSFAMEPSWLAHQLNMLYLPFWLAATLRRTSAQRFRLLGLTLENGLLLGGLAALWMTYSRIGLLAFGLVAVYLFARANVWLAGWVRRRWLPRVHRVLAAGLVFVVLAGVYAGAAYAGVRTMMRVDDRMEALFTLPGGEDEPVMAYINQLHFAERVLYWRAGLSVAGEYPLMGVGLGNVGRFFPQTLASYGYKLMEIRQVMERGTAVPNAKNLWVRLLSETGLVGFGLFAAWLVTLLAATARLRRARGDLLPTIGLAGVLVLIGLLAEGLSVDSFALPYYWVSLGLVTAACRLPGASRIEEELNEASETTRMDRTDDAGPVQPGMHIIG